MARLFPLIALLLSLYTHHTAAQTASNDSSSSSPCLAPGEAYNIAERWLSIFQTDINGTGTGSALVPSTLTDNFTVSYTSVRPPPKTSSISLTHAFQKQYYDLGATFNDPTPIYNSSAAVLTSVTGSGYSGALVTNVTYTIIERFATCDISVLRWRSDSLSANATNV